MAFTGVAIPRLFEKSVHRSCFPDTGHVDITDDEKYPALPINLGDQTIEDPVYGVDRKTFTKTPAIQRQC